MGHYLSTYVATDIPLKVLQAIDQIDEDLGYKYFASDIFEYIQELREKVSDETERELEYANERIEELEDEVRDLERDLMNMEDELEQYKGKYEDNA